MGDLEWGTSVYCWWQRVRNMHGKAYLSMDVAIESKVADTECSTATDAQKHTICVSVCALTQLDSKWIRDRRNVSV